MEGRPKVSEALGKLIDKGLFERLPVTFTTYFYDRIKDWDLLFPAEQHYFELLFGLFDRVPAGELTALFEPVVAAETLMGVNEKNWPRHEFTLQNVDFLNRSPKYPVWRKAISDVFARVDPVIDGEIIKQGRPSLALILSPADLPVGPDRMWKQIPGGQRVSLKIDGVEPDAFVPALLGGKDSLMARYSEKRARSAYDTWVVETGTRLKAQAGGAVYLSYDGLLAYRKKLMDEVRRVVEVQQIRGPRELGERLRAMKMPSGLPKVDADPLLAEFLRSVLLNGNGTLLLNNTFVEWASVQAVRRARPGLSVISFGIRNKVKPFTGLLIFDDPETASPVPTQVDTLGSYVDLEVFYKYAFQEFEKYAQYRRNIAYVFVAEAMDEMLVVAPADFPLLALKKPATLEEVNGACGEWLGLA
jgi:hypothetical protein